MVAAVETLRPLTLADLADFPDDGFRREIFQGELVVSPSPALYHQVIISRLMVAMGNFMEGREFGIVVTSVYWRLDVEASMGEFKSAGRGPREPKKAPRSAR